MKDKITTLQMKEGKPFRILQLTDIHLGGYIFTNKEDKQAIEDVKLLVETAKPDFIAVTGDAVYPMPFWPKPFFSGSLNNLKASKKFGSLMESFNIPWGFVFGNHDCEVWSFYNKDKLSDYYESLDNCVFQKGEYFDKDRGNYSIKLLNSDGSLNTLLMFLDSNSYLGKMFFSGFDVIHDEQIEWYKKIVSENTVDGKIPTSLAFFHIPPKEFRDAWEKCYRGDPSVQYNLGFIQEKDNYVGYPKTKEGKFFEEMVKLGSCKGMFFGHDHLSTMSLTYKGIQMTYGMSIDHLAYKGIKKRHGQRGGTIITIQADGSFDVSMLPLEDLQGISYYKTKMDN